jgi:hypothetical protein
MSTAERIEALMQLLLRGTRDNALQWQPTADENAFRLSSPTANIRLNRSEAFDELEHESYFHRTLSVLNDQARLIEEYSPTTAAAKQAFDELYALARRSAYNTDAVLEKLMTELQSQVSR